MNNMDKQQDLAIYSEWIRLSKIVRKELKNETQRFYLDKIVEQIKTSK